MQVLWLIIRVYRYRPSIFKLCSLSVLIMLSFNDMFFKVQWHTLVWSVTSKIIFTFGWKIVYREIFYIAIYHTSNKFPAFPLVKTTSRECSIFYYLGLIKKYGVSKIQNGLHHKYKIVNFHRLSIHKVCFFQFYPDL